MQILGPTATRAGVTLSAQTLSRIMDIAAGANATIENLTLRDGAAAGGGAVNITGGTAQFIGCLFTENVSTTYGGAVAGTAGALSFLSCTFSDNSAFLDGGAAHSNGAGMLFSNCTIALNTADSDNNSSGRRRRSRPNLGHAAIEEQHRRRQHLAERPRP